MENKMNEQNNEFNLRMLLSYVVRYWKWFVASVVICLACAVVYLNYATRVYQISAKVLIQDKEKGTFSSQADFLMDFGFQGTNSSVENEIEVLCSKSVVQGAVADAGLYVKYFVDDFVTDRPIYKAASPVTVYMSENDINSLTTPIVLDFTLNGDSTYSVSYKYKNGGEGLDVESSPELIASSLYLLKTVKGDLLLTTTDKQKIDGLKVVISPLGSASAVYKGSLVAQPISKTASVAMVSVNDVVPQNGIDFINALINRYNYQTNEDKKIITRKTKEFLDERVEMLNEELALREKNLAEYKKEQQLINPTIDAPRMIENKSVYTKKLEDINLSIEQVRYLKEYVADSKNNRQTIPVIAGKLDNPSLLTFIESYNSSVLKRNDLLRSATESNPAVVALTSEVDEMSRVIKEALATTLEALKMQKESVAQIANQYSNRIASAPAIESRLTDMTRERDVKSQLYVMLLQKYEENALAMAITADNLKCIDNASASGPVAPRRSMTLMLALAVGVLIPSAVIYLRELLRTKIENAADIEVLTQLPIVGSVPFKKGIVEKQDAIVVKANSNNVMMEAFRSIRTNMQFLLKNSGCRVVMFTSTTSGEGKTFVSSNLAVSQALLNKKVLLMGLDIRRPRLSEVFSVNRDKLGITSFLAGDGTDVESLDSYIIPSGISPDLDLLPAGIIPPNPAELLASENLDIAINYLKQKYDYIIIDTAPVGLVTDSFILSRVADIVVYVARSNFTEKNNLEFLNAAVADKKLQNVAVVLNAEQWNKRKLDGKYKYAYSYYGFGYGSGRADKKK